MQQTMLALLAGVAVVHAAHEAAVMREARLVDDIASSTQSVCHNAHAITPTHFSSFARRSLRIDNATATVTDTAAARDAMTRTLFGICARNRACAEGHHMHEDARTKSYETAENYLVFRYVVSTWLDEHTTTLLSPLTSFCTPRDGLQRRDVAGDEDDESSSSVAHEQLGELLEKVWLLEMRVKLCENNFAPCTLPAQKLRFDETTRSVHCACIDDIDVAAGAECHARVSRQEEEPLNYSQTAAISVIATSLIIGVSIVYRNVSEANSVERYATGVRRDKRRALRRALKRRTEALPEENDASSSSSSGDSSYSRNGAEDIARDREVTEVL